MVNMGTTPLKELTEKAKIIISLFIKTYQQLEVDKVYRNYKIIFFIF